MNRLDMIRWAMESTEKWTTRLAETMRDKPFVQPTSNGGNHPMWVMGHITFIEGAVRHVLFGEPHPVGHWAPLFSMGSKPTTNPADYPPFEEVLANYRTFRAANRKLLEEIGDAGLDRKPKDVPPGFEKEMTTFGQVFMLICLHQMQHQGQLSDARRAAGLTPIV